MRSRSSSADSSGWATMSALAWLGAPRRSSSRAPTAEQICPGVQ